MGSGGIPRVDAWPHAKYSHEMFCFVGKPVLYGFEKSREIVWRVVVYEDNLLCLGEKLWCHAIEAESGTLMKVISDWRNHAARAPGAAIQQAAHPESLPQRIRLPSRSINWSAKLG